MITLKKIKIWLNKEKTKNYINIGAPIIITIIGSSLSIFTKHATLIFVFLLVTCGIVCCIQIHYSKYEQSKNEEIERLNQSNQNKDDEINIYKERLNQNYTLISFCDNYIKTISKSVNKVANGIEKNGKISLELYELDTYCEQICEQCCRHLSSALKTEYENLSVSFSHVYNNDNKQYIYMSGHSKELNKPDYYRNHVCIDDKMKDYYITKYIKNKKHKVDISLNPKEIKRKFKEHATSSNYFQYVIYPVMCDNNKLLGIFQIITYNNIKISSQKNDVEKILKSNLLIFMPLILLIYKIEKGLTATPHTK